MSHNAGFTYGLFGNSPVDKMYQADNPLDAPSLQAFIEKVATKPLLYQPGEKWVYSVSVDIQGYLVQKLSGQTFPDFLRDRIFTPLGMKDTGFMVPAAKLPRVEITRPETALGRTSTESIQSGLYHGHVGAIRNLLAALTVEAVNGRRPQVVGTGGFARVVEAEHLVDEIVPELAWQMGRPIRFGGERKGVEERSRYMIDIAEHALATVEKTGKEGFKRYNTREPLGTVMVIATWTYPVPTAGKS
mgnify:CR=1 FL=1